MAVYSPKLTGYYRQDGTYQAKEAVAFFDAVTKTASADGDTFDVGSKSGSCLTLSVTAASGTTPTLDITVSTSEDNSTWRTLGTFTQATGTTSERKSFGKPDRYMRAVATLGGTTPSFTFSVSGDIA